MRKIVSRSLKILIVLSSFGGVLLSLVFARYDGYSHWSRRLLYFTAQSNLWIGFNSLALLFRPQNLRLYRQKFVFTVAITITGIVYCALLGPFSDKSFHPWSFPNLLTHIAAPLFSILDFFLDDRPFTIDRKGVLSAALPPLVYFSIASVLYFLSVDFGRGVPYPYFFMHYRSPVGLFGFSREFPFFIGSFYWFALFTFITLALAALYARLKEKRREAGTRRK
ncbi:MAG: hypothetical protein IJ514_05530 [Clostridia bacterium]|nr:hypothetical protein [Clostridia bacterium]